MNNLKLCWEISSKLKLQSDDEVICFVAIDIERNRLLFASSINSIYTSPLPSPNQNRGAWSKTILSTSVESLNLEPGDCITSMDYLMEKEALVVGTSYGLLLLYSVDDYSTEVVGRVEGGVKCISPSPDGDLLGIVTGFGQILVMTHDWDLLYETKLDDAPEGVDVTYFNSNDSLGSPISWRGDGKFFATMSRTYNSDPLHKKLKIWERDSGTLHSISDSKNFVGSVLDWMPSGAKIATVCQGEEEKTCISINFFEKNGLERSSFSVVQGDEATIELVKWNCNSDLLAAIVRCENYDMLKIWFFSNNHWFLKQEIRFLRQDSVRFMWDPTKPFQLICWTINGQVTIFNFVWITAVMDNSTAFLIDDSKILVTPFSLSLIPPPMYLFSLRFPSAVSDMSFCYRVSKNYLAASLSNGNLCIIELPALDTWGELEGREFNVEASSSETRFGTFSHLIWLDTHVLLGISNFGFSHSGLSSTLLGKDDHPGYGYYLQEITLLCAEDHGPDTVNCSGWHGKISNQLSLEELVVNICSNPAKRYSVFVQFDGGKVFEYMSKTSMTDKAVLKKCDGVGFPSSCPWMDVVLVGDSGLSTPLFFGLDCNSRLFLNGKLICHNCRSFFFYSSCADLLATHLILATQQDLLFIVDIADVLLWAIESKYGNFLPSCKKRNAEDERKYINIWERGARIAGVLHGDDSAVVLQTMRGNLECIYPRKLVLASITNALVQGRFRDSFLMVRRHRIDFNIIVDHCGLQTFLQSAAEFVRQVNNLSYITEFVCAMKNENVMETLYKNYDVQPLMTVPKIIEGKSLNSEINSKVSCVLHAIRKGLEEQIGESPGRELCILTTLARSETPALEEALRRVKVIREMELSSIDDPKRNSYPSAEESLRHLLWLSNSEAVYEAALGLYDLNLAAIVALNSQRDPKEFLPFLQALEQMPTLLMQYNIDLKLGRHENALKHIVSLGDAYHEESLSLMKNNPQLFSLGLQLITDPAKRRQVLEAWGDHLSYVKCFNDAAMTYLCCSCLEKALKSYRSCGNWVGVLTVAGFVRLGKEEILQLAHELCEELQALGKPGEAAKIAFEYCGDVNGGVSLLITARDWEEALRVAFLHRRDDLVLEIKNASLDCARMLIGEYEECLEKVGKYLARYLAVRQRRLLLNAKLQSEDRSINELDDDTASETSSNLSGMSAYTTGTKKSTSASATSTTASKARDTRRQRKKGKLRAGSPDEEAALVEHLRGMSLTAGGKCELRSLLISLLTLGEADTARKLQRFAENFQLSQLAAVKLAEDATASDSADEHAFSLNQYLQKVREEVKSSDALSWQAKILVPA